MSPVKRAVPVGATTIVGLITALAGIIPIAAKAIQEGSAITVNGPERWLAIASIAVGGITLIGRYLQSVTGFSNTVRVGITTVVSWGGSLLLFLPVLTKAYGEGKTALHGPEKYLAIGGIAFTVITQAMRYLQAALAPQSTT